LFLGLFSRLGDPGDELDETVAVGFRRDGGDEIFVVLHPFPDVLRLLDKTILGES